MQVESYYSHNDFLLWNGDSASICKQLPPNSVDCVFADPPYFLSSGNGKVRINNRIISFDKGDWVCKNSGSRFSISSFGKSQTHRQQFQTNASTFQQNILSGLERK